MDYETRIFLIGQTVKLLLDNPDLLPKLELIPIQQPTRETTNEINFKNHLTAEDFRV